MLYPYLVHYKRWPTPHAYAPSDPLDPPENRLPGIEWSKYYLTPDEEARKYAAIQLHKTQYKSDPKYLQSFMRTNELFGDFPPALLPSSLFSTPLTENPDGTVTEQPGQLTDSQNASFLGLERRTVRLDGNNLEITIDFSRPFGRDVGVAVYVFGYRPDSAFADMPKIHIEFGAIEHRIYDQGNRLPTSSVTITRLPRRVTMSIPLELLGNPDRILTGARSYLGELPLDILSWRELDLSPQ